MADLVGIKPTPQNHETRVITIGRDDGPVIFPVPLFTGLFQKKNSLYQLSLFTPGHHSVGKSFTVNGESA